MSLINDMLNDLDKRRAASAPDSSLTQWLDSDSCQPESKTRQTIFVILGFVVVIATVVLLYQYQQNKTEPISVISESTGLSELLIDKASVQSWLSELVFEKSNNTVLVHFNLNKKSLYNIHRNNEGLVVELLSVTARLNNALIESIDPVDSVLIDRIENTTEVSLNIAGDFHYEIIDKAVNSAVITVKITPIVTSVTSKKTHSVNDNAMADVDKKTIKNDSSDINVHKIAVVSAQNTKTKKSAAVSKDGGVEQKKSIALVKKPVALSGDQKDQRLLDNATTLLNQNRYVDAEQLLLKELKLLSAAPRSTKLLVSLLLSQGRLEQAQMILISAKNQFSSDIDLLAMQARLYLLTGQANKAAQLLVNVTPSVSEHTDYYELLAQSAQRANRFVLAETSYRALLEVDDREGQWWIGLAVSLDAQGKSTSAKRAYKNALDSGRIAEQLKDYAQQRLSAR